MAEVTAVIMPQVNVNDTEGLLRDWLIRPGEHVRAGMVLASVETSKATEDLIAPRDGYFFPLVSGQENYKVGAKLAVISDDAQYVPSAAVSELSVKSHDVVMTKKARELAEKLGLMEESLPQGVLLKEKDILAMAEKTKATGDERTFDRLEQYVQNFVASGGDLSHAILIAGAGTTAKIVIDTIRLLPEYELFGIVDCNYMEGQEWDILGVPVIAGDSVDVLRFLYDHGITMVCNSVASLTNLRARESVYQKLKTVGFAMPYIVHPTAFIEENAVLEEGVFVHAHAYVGTQAHIGHNTFINTHAIISHECEVGCSVFCAPNATVAGIVTIGDCTLVGMCVTILSRIKIGRDVILTNGCRVFNNIEDGVHFK